MLQRLTRDLASAVMAVDSGRPTAVNKRSGIAFAPGLGPHSEVETFTRVLHETKCAHPEWYQEVVSAVPYPKNPRQKCDFRITTPEGALFVEGKLLRLKGDNGKPNDNMLMHILSPYPQHRSALTDCHKLRNSGFGGAKIIVIIGYSYSDLSLELAAAAFERLAAGLLSSCGRGEASFFDLCHSVHREGKVMAWQVQ